VAAEICPGPPDPTLHYLAPAQAWYAEFLLEINLKILLGKTGGRLNFKITLISLHIYPGSDKQVSKLITSDFLGLHNIEVNIHPNTSVNVANLNSKLTCHEYNKYL
jgi:hypothetical protein